MLLFLEVEICITSVMIGMECLLINWNVSVLITGTCGVWRAKQSTLWFCWKHHPPNTEVNNLLPLNTWLFDCFQVFVDFVCQVYLYELKTLYYWGVMCKFLLCRSVPVGPEQVLLRGAHLRNTQWIFGES